MQPEIAKLFEGQQDQVFAKGKIVISSGIAGGLFYVKSGFVKRFSINRFGDNSIQSLYGPGYFFPLTPIFIAFYDLHVSQNVTGYVYKAMTNSVLMRINIDQLAQRVNENPEIYRWLFFESGRRLEANIQQLENIALRDAYRRVAHQLVFLARSFGTIDTDGISLIIPVTQQDLSDMLSLSRETVSRQFSRLIRKGLLVRKTKFIIPDLSKLEDVYN